MIPANDVSSQNAQLPIEEMPNKTPMIPPAMSEKKENANAAETDKSSDIEEEVHGTCCFCGYECNPCSQACGSCARSATAYTLGWKDYV